MATSWFRGIKGKLLLFGALPTLVLCVLTYVSTTALTSLSKSVEVLGNERIPATRATANMTKSMSAAFRFAYRAHAAAGKPDLRKAAIASSRAQMKEFEQHFESMGRLQLEPEVKEHYSKIAPLWAPIVKMTTECLDLLEKNDAASDAQALVHLFTNVGKPAAELTAALVKIDELETARTQSVVNQATLSGRTVNNVMLGVCIGSILLIVLAVLIFSTRLSSSLRKIAHHIDGSGRHVSSNSSQLNSASQQLSSGSSEAAASLEETVASLEELSSMVKQNADSAKEANQLSQVSRQTAERGDQEIQKLIGSMSEMGQGARKIEEIINVIDDIAFQTNLLALNAAVEAARAGDQGKGFAVVAEAVRALALRSASAAKDITGLIKENVSRAEVGAKAAEGSGLILREIVTSAKKVAELNGEIASACQEQSSGLNQISKAMNQLDQATQGNAASAEEVAASSGELSDQANDLRRFVEDLLTIVDGTESTQAEARTETRTSSHAAPPKARSTQGAQAPLRQKPQLSLVKGKKAERAEAVIPFDDEPSGDQLKKTGTTEGF